MNGGNWEGLEVASPSVLVQLLQKWFQAFEQPILSEIQLTGMLAPMGTQRGNEAVSRSAMQQQNADGSIQELKMTGPAAGALQLQQELPEVAIQLSSNGCLAAISSLPVMQRTLIERIVNCIVAITEQNVGDGSRQILLQWLATALTNTPRCGTINSRLNVQQSALLRVLEHYASSSGTLQTITATPVQPLTGLLEAAVVTEGVASESIGAQTQAAACQLDECATVQADCSSNAKLGAHLPGTVDAGAVQDPHGLGKPDFEVGHSIEDGCMWFHNRVAKVGLRRFHEQTR